MFSAPLNQFLFAKRYHISRHLVYWACYLLLWAGYWTLVQGPFYKNVERMLIWFPVFMAYSYPVAYIAVPRLLLKSRYITFALVIIGWGILGWYFNIYYRGVAYFPLADWMHIQRGTAKIEPASFLCMTTTVGSMTISTLAKHWVKKQREWLQAEREKATAQLQLLKAQLHPHFLFNTLNNIYSFSLESSHKTPQMILKLSSLLSYMLYECKSEEVLLEKEIEVMKNYIGLEKERYGEKIDISVNIEGDIEDKFIAPLLILPFLENAFKHGTSEQLDKPWLSVDIAVKGQLLKCKVINSKNEIVPFHEDGVGINNVRKRLELLYPEQYELKLLDEGPFFVVSLLLSLNAKLVSMSAKDAETVPTLVVNENTLSLNRR